MLGLPMGMFAVGLGLAQRQDRAGLMVAAAWFVATEWLGTWVPVRHAWTSPGASQHACLGGRSGSAQALALAQLRAIEQRRPLVRIASSGFSAIVTPAGRVAWTSGLTEATAYVARVEWSQGRTLYGHIGDAIVWLSLVVVAWSLARAVRRA